MQQKTNVLEGTAWMVGITLVLFFLPLVNGLIGGFVGGYKVGSPGKAFLSAILPAVIVGVALWVALLLVELPVVGAVAGLAGGTLILLADIGIFIGALIGGAAGHNKRNSLNSPVPQ